MAVDLGTANTLVYVAGRGVVLFEPSVVAIDERTNEVYAVGTEAKRMLGRTPAHITATRPLKDGVITDFEITEQMLRHFIRKADPRRLAHPRVVVCVPSGLTGVERRAVEEATRNAGAREAFLIEEPMAAAIGAGLPVAEPAGSLIVDVGGGTSEMAVISLGGMVASRSLRVGGDAMDEAIVAHVRRERTMAIGLQSAEEVKLAIGSAAPVRDDAQAEIRGRDLSSGLPRTVLLSGAAVRTAIAEPVRQIVEALKETLERTPPELAGDVVELGIVLAGGGALLVGLDERLREETGLEAALEGLVGVYDNRRFASASPYHLYVCCFRGRVTGGAARPSSETTEVRFVDPDALPEDMSAMQQAMTADAAAGRSAVYQ
jgi:rod shape-determining protein MreB